MATRLAGCWDISTHERAADTDQFPLNERIWGHGHVSWARSEFVPRTHADLTNDSGSELVVIDRSPRKHEFLVAALGPRGSELTTITKAPNSIAASSDPMRAASRVDERSLPRYEQAVHTARIEQGLPRR